MIPCEEHIASYEVHLSKKKKKKARQNKKPGQVWLNLEIQLQICKKSKETCKTIEECNEQVLACGKL